MVGGGGVLQEVISFVWSVDDFFCVRFQVQIGMLLVRYFVLDG